MILDSVIRTAARTDYDDEVLNAGWLACPELHLRQVAGCDRHPGKPGSTIDPDEFMRGIYRLQE